MSIGNKRAARKRPHVADGQPRALAAGGLERLGADLLHDAAAVDESVMGGKTGKFIQDMA